MALTGLKFSYFQPNRVSFFTSDPAFQTASKPKTQNAVVPALRAPQHFGFWV